MLELFILIPTIKAPTQKNFKKVEKMANAKKIAIAVGCGLLAIYIANKIPAVKKIVGGV